MATRIKPTSPRLCRGREASQLYAAWPLAGRGSPARESVAGNGLSFVGSPAPAWITGPDGPAISFSGSATAYLQTARPILNPLLTDFTLALWFNVASGNSQQVIVQQLDGTKSTGGAGTGRSWLYLPSGGVNSPLASFLGAVNTQSVTQVTPGVWHHAAVSCQGPRIALYLDGRLEASNTLAPEDNAAELRIGNGKVSGQAFTGAIGRAGVMLWQRALLASEVQRLWIAPYRIWSQARRWAEFGSLAPAGGSASAGLRRRRWFPGLARNR
jgi:hypothetical protein